MQPQTTDLSAPPEPLLPLVAQGDAEAVKACIDRYGSLVWSLVRKSIRNHAQAEDAVQEIFIAFWKAADRFDPERGTESLYLTTIARRKLIDLFRSQSRNRETDAIDDIEVPMVDRSLEQVDASDEANLALAGLKELAPEHRELLEMWFVGGMTHSEIATSTGIPLGTVKSKLRRSLLRIRELIEGGRVASEASA